MRIMVTTHVHTITLMLHISYDSCRCDNENMTAMKTIFFFLRLCRILHHIATTIIQSSTVFYSISHFLAVLFYEIFYHNN